MPHEEGSSISLHLRLSPELLTAILRIAGRSGRPLEATIVSLLWVAAGQIELRPWPEGDDRG